MARLHVERCVERGAEPTRWIVFLHGILGNGSNWSGFARRLTRARPEWGALLIDLRLHGESESGSPPHTVRAAAGDVVGALESEGISPEVMAGHSFGSKVAFRAAALLPEPPASVWLLDADLGGRSRAAGRSTVMRVIAALRELPREFSEREDFIGALRGRGFSDSLAGWLGKNLSRDGEVLRLTLDLDAIEEILADFHGDDLWPEIGDTPFEVHAVIGGKSDVIGAAAREQIEEAARSGGLLGHDLPSAGHWLHIDAPKALLDLLLDEL